MKKDSRSQEREKQDSFDLQEISTDIDDHFYRLIERKAMRCTLAEYAQAMLDETQRVVAQDTLGELRVSTIFTGIDQNFGSGDPLLFETVVFGLPDDLHPQWRHSTWEQALEHHRQLVASINDNGQKVLLDEIKRIAGQSE